MLSTPMKHKSYLTAISRKALPTPTKWLASKGYVNLNPPRPAFKVLDFGCGKCASVNPPHWFNYDPHYAPMDLSVIHNRMDIVICNYVLCTLPKEERLKVLQEIQLLLTEWGNAYISVRNDKPKQGWGLSSKGTYQGRCEHVTDNMLYGNSQFRIYHLTKKTRLVWLPALMVDYSALGFLHCFAFYFLPWDCGWRNGSSGAASPVSVSVIQPTKLLWTRCSVVTPNSKLVIRR